VSFSFVRTVRDQLCTEQSSPQPATRVGKDGKARKTSYTKKPKPAPEPGPEEKPEVHSADESKQKVRHGKYQDWQRREINPRDQAQTRWRPGLPVKPEKAHHADGDGRPCYAARCGIDGGPYGNDKDRHEQGGAMPYHQEEIVGRADTIKMSHQGRTKEGQSRQGVNGGKGQPKKTIKHGTLYQLTTV
jgi:hypothetical protein